MSPQWETKQQELRAQLDELQRATEKWCASFVAQSQSQPQPQPQPQPHRAMGDVSPVVRQRAAATPVSGKTQDVFDEGGLPSQPRLPHLPPQSSRFWLWALATAIVVGAVIGLGRWWWKAAL